MPLTEHLAELRKRSAIALVGVLVSFIILFNFSEQLFNVLTFPLKAEISLKASEPYISIKEKTAPPLVFFAVAEAFWMHLKVSFVAALVLSLPMTLYQLWQFIAPGLLEKERRYVVPFVISATILFVAGALFCFLVVLPFAISFLLGYKTAQFSPMLSVEKYIDFCLKFILAFGAVFELPLVITFLTRFGVVTPETLASKRKYAVLFAFVLAAVLTPTPDAFNQTLMAVPIIFLFEIGILTSRIFRGRRGNG